MALYKISEKNMNPPITIANRLTVLAAPSAMLSEVKELTRSELMY